MTENLPSQEPFPLNKICRQSELRHILSVLSDIENVTQWPLSQDAKEDNITIALTVNWWLHYDLKFWVIHTDEYY